MPCLSHARVRAAGVAPPVSGRSCPFPASAAPWNLDVLHTACMCLSRGQPNSPFSRGHETAALDNGRLAGFPSRAVQPSDGVTAESTNVDYWQGKPVMKLVRKL